MSKPLNSGTQTNRVSVAIAVANQRAALARSLPNARVKKPPMIGSQMIRLNKGSALCKGSGFTSQSLSIQVTDEYGQHHDQADYHREGVMEQVTGLGASADRSHQFNQTGAAVDRNTVDHVGIDRTRRLAEAKAAAGQTADPQCVEAVLVLQHPHRPGKRLAGDRKSVG